jgi:hypothetical protein
MLAEIKRQMQHGGVIDTPEERDRFFRYLDVLGPRFEPLVVRGGSRRRREFMARCLHHYGPGREGGYFVLFETGVDLGPSAAATELEECWRKSVGGTLFVDEFDLSRGALLDSLGGICRQLARARDRKAQPVLPASGARLVLGRKSEQGPDMSQRSATASRLEEILEPITVDMRRLKPNREHSCGSGAAHCVTADPEPAANGESEAWREQLEHLLTRIWKEGGARQGGGLLRQLRERADFELAELALNETGGNRKRAAELLGVSTATISRRLSSGKS